MDPLLLQAIVSMNIALVFYTWAVFSARKHGLSRKHIPLFGIGLVCDYLGTNLMLEYGYNRGVIPEMHIVIGMASLMGMAFHFLLALAASATTNMMAIDRLFLRISLYIYSGWLIAFASGTIVGITSQ